MTLNAAFEDAFQCLMGFEMSESWSMSPQKEHSLLLRVDENALTSFVFVRVNLEHDLDVVDTFEMMWVVCHQNGLDGCFSGNNEIVVWHYDKDNENDKQNDVKSQICRIINICYSIKIKSKEGNEQTNINDSLNVFIVDTFSGLCVCSCVFVCVCEWSREGESEEDTKPFLLK
jgi:hypothetical protein